MTKKIRFPLDMGNGVEVRTLEELQENFSLEKVLGYYADGKLIAWLRDRYMDDIADALEKLDKNAIDFYEKICEIFGVEYSGEEADIQKIGERNKKLALLKEYTTDNNFMDVIDDIAFNQDDLYDLLDEDKTTVYLCGDKFSIPLSKINMKYIGINGPTVVISSQEIVDWEEKGIELIGVKFDENYQEVINTIQEEQKEKVVASDLRDKMNLEDSADYWILDLPEFKPLSLKEEVESFNTSEKIDIILEDAINCPHDDGTLSTIILDGDDKELYLKLVADISYKEFKKNELVENISSLVKLASKYSINEYKIVCCIIWRLIGRNENVKDDFDELDIRKIIKDIIIPLSSSCAASDV